MRSCGNTTDLVKHLTLNHYREYEAFMIFPSQFNALPFRSSEQLLQQQVAAVRAQEGTLQKVLCPLAIRLNKILEMYNTANTYMFHHIYICYFYVFSGHNFILDIAVISLFLCWHYLLLLIIFFK
ncbi:hypothetical protein XENOCAPTIV_004437 [Xenoophorus captivus]|uniref:Uncharacterized protein n=1 Tax=Xenoophorus captivus TaxID=1517983 RepID=A0ABV0S3A8_9TELE